MKRVLVVDDEPVMRKLIGCLLRGRYLIDEAEDGEKALTKASREQYDCVITDVQMPRMSGLHLLGEIKRRRPQTAVIVMSALGEAYASAAMAGGASSFLAKPFPGDALRSALQCV
ncbi:MAG: response regulator [bacterium]|nr:response regulator [bacterium]